MADGTKNPDPTVAPEVLQALYQMQSRGDQLAAEIGRMEVHKAELVGEIHDLNRRASDLLRQEGQRLGIPDGASWKVTPEGKAVIVEG
jgi:hypothetical protein